MLKVCSSVAKTCYTNAVSKWSEPYYFLIFFGDSYAVLSHVYNFLKMSFYVGLKSHFSDIDFGFLYQCSFRILFYLSSPYIFLYFLKWEKFHAVACVN